MSDPISQPELDMALDPAEAFEQMRRQLALLTAAVEGFASRQQAIEARDYAPDIAKLIERQDGAREALLTLAAKPGVSLTPETIAAEIAEAGRTAREADQRLIAEAVAGQRAATQSLDAVIGHARTREQQVDAMTWAWLGGMIAMLLLFAGADLLRSRLAVADRQHNVETTAAVPDPATSPRKR